jgi:hypothetical protein
MNPARRRRKQTRRRLRHALHKKACLRPLSLKNKHAGAASHVLAQIKNLIDQHGLLKPIPFQGEDRISSRLFVEGK